MPLKKRLNFQTKKPQRNSTFELKPFGEKSNNYLNNSYSFINVQHGAIRSSKTISSIMRWIKFIREHPFNQFMMSGNTRTSLFRNVLQHMFQIMNIFNWKCDYKPSESHIEFEGNIIWLFGFNNEGVAGIIPGMTLAGWYADEINTYPKILVELALDRLSEKGSQAFWTLNPDNPYHYLYKEYIQNEEKITAGDVKVWNYTIWDNPNLSDEYIERTIRRYPKGTVGYKRKILGQAAVAEGIIYNKFVEAQNVFNPEDPLYNELNYNKYYLSTDYGAGNVSVVGLFGVIFNQNGNHYHLLDEFYYDVNDPKNNNVALTDAELVDKVLTMLDGRPLHMWFTPHDAASLRAELAKRKYQSQHIKYESYTPDVLNDIQEIHSLIAQERFMISKKCSNSVVQAQTYAWDEKAKNRGEDKPLKVNDHCPDMWRGAILGSRQIKKMHTYCGEIELW